MMEKYPVYCSWCEKKGIKTVVNWKEVEGSSGICGACHADMMRQLAALRSVNRSPLTVHRKNTENGQQITDNARRA